MVSNPLRYTDVDGRIVVRGPCCELPSEQELKNAAKKISDPCTKKCVDDAIGEKRGVGAIVFCPSDDPFSNQSADTKFLAQCAMSGNLCALSPVGGCEPGQGTNLAVLCPSAIKLKKNCQIEALVHEFAHTCGWDHQKGKGVPAEDGKLSGDCGTVQ
jgi:hypothetical protein